MSGENRGLVNFRDLGGLKTEDGFEVKKRLLLRSDSLSFATDKNLKRLEKDYRLKMVVDLRTTQEAERHPDRLPEGAKYLSNPVVPQLQDFFPKSINENSGAGYFEKLAIAIEDGYVDIDKLLEDSYRQYLVNDFSLNAYRVLFLKALQFGSQGAILFHCSAGKDRTGVGAALLLSVLGVEKDQIVADYLKTNVNVSALQELALSQARQYKKDLEPRTVQQIKDFLGVRQEWIDSVLDYLDQQYDSPTAFAKEALGLSYEQIATLKHLFLEKA